MAVLGLCVHCGRPAFRTCTACGLPMCEAHTAAEAPTMCVACARGHAPAAPRGTPGLGHVPTSAK